MGLFQSGVEHQAVRSTVEGYASHFDGAGARSAHATRLAKDYYQLATDFYEYGWGQSFHFAPRCRGETWKESLVRTESYLALRLGLTPGTKVLDVGCGVGGPMRTIARLSGAHVTGITLSRYQAERGRRHNERALLSHLCEVIEGDFNAMLFEAGRFDAAYSLESCCHAADRRGPFREVFRVSKPGALFAGHDWCMTARYLPGDPEHERI